jgi:hypothetical protein
MFYISQHAEEHRKGVGNGGQTGKPNDKQGN